MPRSFITLSAAVAVAASQALLPRLAVSAEHGEEEHHGHHAKNHIAFLIGHAEEEQADGHHESGQMLGVEYFRTIHPDWRLGLAAELESFGDDHERSGVLAVPLSYFVNDEWRVFVAPGLEFRDREADKFMFRVGTGYTFNLNDRLSISPEFQIDFIAGGTQVYVFALAFGLGF